MAKIQNNIVVRILDAVLSLFAKGPKDGIVHLFAGIAVPRRHSATGEATSQSSVRFGEDGKTLLCVAGGSSGPALYSACKDVVAKMIRAVVALEAGEALPSGGKVSEEYARKALVAFRNVLVKMEMSEDDFIGECEEFILAAGESRGITMLKVYLHKGRPFPFVNLQLSNEDNVSEFIKEFPDAEAAIKVTVGDKTMEERKPLRPEYEQWQATTGARAKEKESAKIEERKQKLLAQLEKLGAKVQVA